MVEQTWHLCLWLRQPYTGELDARLHGFLGHRGQDALRLNTRVATGDGPRGCPGWRFAMQEAKVGLFHLFRRFSFHLAPGQASPPMGGTISLSPVNGVLVSVHSR